MRPLICLLAMALLSAPGALCRAQDSPKVDPAKADSADYVLGSDDIVEINVLNHPELNRTVLILPDGKIQFPEVGELKAAGKTASELGAEIRKGLEKVRNNVSVSVLVKEMKSRRVRVVGAVKNQGAIELRRKLKLMDVIALSGGFTTKPQKVRGRLSRGAETIPLDIVKANENPGSDANITLQPEDIILLDEVEPVFVYLAGQVERPGPYELDSNTTLMSLLLRAGIKDDAAVSQAHIARGTELVPLPGLREAVRAGKPNAEVLGFRLKPGDQIFVPQLQERYSVMGMVVKPGVYPVPETKEVTVLEALTLAGSVIPGQGDAAKAGIIRQENGQPEMIPVNFDALLQKHDYSQNRVMKPGDILYVPQKGQKGFRWQDLMSPLSALSILGFRIWR